MRQLSICNACRYCEGYCAVWDAIEFKSILNEGDIYHLSNLCHDCRDCYYACPYNEPEHDFKLNIPKVLGQVRVETYKDNLKPRFFGFALEKPILVTATSTIIAVAISIAYAAFSFGVDSFSSLPMTTIIPISLFKPATILVYLYTITLWSWEGLAYWSKINQKERLSASGIGRGIRDAIFHKNFLGGGEGCKVPKLNSRYLRVISHLLVFFGFITALVSISFYPDITGYFALAYLFGSCSVTIGTAGMIYIHLKESKRSRSDEQALIDYPFTILLFFAGITGIIVPLSLGTTLFNWNFIIHDALIMVVFLLAPFSKFIHPVFRIISLMKYSSDSLRLSQK